MPHGQPFFYLLQQFVWYGRHHRSAADIDPLFDNAMKIAAAGDDKIQFLGKTDEPLAGFFTMAGVRIEDGAADSGPPIILSHLWVGTQGGRVRIRHSHPVLAGRHDSRR